jgi:alpha-beta hydrolase superfamily lysophospholipase
MLPCLPRMMRYEYDGARHELLNETPDVVADIWKRVDAFLDDVDGQNLTHI